MIGLSVAAAAIAPGAALLAYFYLKDKYDPEPVSAVVRMFVFGMALVFPAMLLQRILMIGFGEHPLFVSFVLSGALEEALKWLVIYALIYRHVVFDEPYDGIVYAVAVSLGFATIENLIYALYHYATFSGLIVRALLPVTGHALFGVVMGFYFGQAKFAKSKAKRERLLLVALLVPLLYHGGFDAVLLLPDKFAVFVLPLLAFLWFRALWKVKLANARSPLRSVYREEKIKTPTSGL